MAATSATIRDEGEDYHIFQNDDMVKRPQGGGVQPEKIFLTISCLEYFIARKVRPIFEIYRQCRQVVSNRARAVRMPYHIRRYVTNYPQIPIGYFSILQQMTMQLIAPLEFQGYTLPEQMVPDISEGRLFCKWLRDVKGIDPDSFPNYQHHYEDGRAANVSLLHKIRSKETPSACRRGGIASRFRWLVEPAYRTPLRSPLIRMA